MRTLENWQRGSREELAPPGRPGHPASLRRHALFAVARELHRQGETVGWRAIHRALGISIPVRLVQASVGALKRRRRARLEAWRVRRRVHVRVLAREAIWSADATHLGRCEGIKIEGQLIRDAGTARIVQISLGVPACGEDVVRTLESARIERGGLPLVLSTDNGPAYRSQVLEEYLRRHRVVHLRNLPRTPQHNAWAERAIGEVKQDCRWETGQGIPALAAALEEGRRRLDHHRLRASRGYRTAAACDFAMERGYHLVRREDFYERVQQALCKARRCPQGERKTRLAQREAIFVALEKFGLVERSRGGVPTRARQGEIKS